tara:strand:+ start:686 stop:946 length:261 start_codon:yes stop_codon:yes gene_type:complete
MSQSANEIANETIDSPSNDDVSSAEILESTVESFVHVDEASEDTVSPTPDKHLKKERTSSFKDFLHVAKSKWDRVPTGWLQRKSTK